MDHRFSVHILPSLMQLNIAQIQIWNMPEQVVICTQVGLGGVMLLVVKQIF